LLLLFASDLFISSECSAKPSSVEEAAGRRDELSLEGKRDDHCWFVVVSCFFSFLSPIYISRLMNELVDLVFLWLVLLDLDLGYVYMSLAA
jgi:hypothetical protein